MLDVSECIKASQLNVSGISTVSTLISPSLVAGSTLDEVNITGITTVGGLLDANKGSNVIAGATFDEVNITGFTTTTSGVNITSGGLNVAGVTTLSKMVNADKGLTVTAGSRLQEVNITGFTTSSSGVSVAEVNVSGVSTFNDNITVADDKKIQFGTSDDLEIWHNSTNQNSYIKESGSGSLIIQAAGFVVEDLSGNDYLYALDGGSTALQFDGSTKLTTESSGINIVGTTTTGQLAVTGVSTFTGAIDANGDLDVDGHTNLDNISVAGISTFTGDAEILVGAAITIGRTGVSTFVSDLHVGGSQAAGVVLTSPDGTRYRLVVANGGALSTSAV
jgi:hypothetical protein